MTAIRRNAAFERIIEVPGSQSEESRLIAHMMAPLGRRDCVYFVGFNKWVKIGYSSCILTRVEKLDCLPEPVTLLALVPGDRTLEAQLHEKFIRYHSHAEWFVNEGALNKHIEKIRDRARRECMK